MKKCFVKVFTTTFCILLSFSLCFSLPVSADVFVPDVNILVRADASTSSYSYPFVTLRENEFVQVASGSDKLVSSTVRISFVSSSFVPGVEYHFQFVIGSPLSRISVSSGSVAGSFIPSSGAAKDLIWGTDINFGLVDVQTYPNPFNSWPDFDYSSEAYFISGSFVPNDDSGAMSLDINFSGDAYYFAPGYAYMSFSATDEAYNQGLIANIYTTVNNIYTNLTNGFNTLNSSISSLSSSVTSSLSRIELSMGSISAKLDDILASLGNDVGPGDVDTDKLDQSASDLNNANDKLLGDLSDLGAAQDKAESDIASDNAAIEGFLSGFSVDSSEFFSEIVDTIDHVSSGIAWVSAFLGFCLGFEPLYMIFFVSSFMHILFMLLNTTHYGISSFAHRSRSQQYHAENLSAYRERTRVFERIVDNNYRLRR